MNTIVTAPPDTTTQPMSQADIDEYWRYRRCLDYGLGIFAINEQAKSAEHEGLDKRLAPGPHVHAAVANESLAFLVDTGSPINILDESTFARLAPMVKLDTCSTNFFGYSSTTPLEVMGQFATTVSYKSRATSASFIVIKGFERCLMSHSTAIELGIIVFDSQVITSPSFFKPFRRKSDKSSMFETDTVIKFLEEEGELEAGQSPMAKVFGCFRHSHQARSRHYRPARYRNERKRRQPPSSRSTKSSHKRRQQPTHRPVYPPGPQQTKIYRSGRM